MNELNLLINEVLKVAKYNLDILENINKNIEKLLLEHIFEITKIFVFRNKKTSGDDFNLAKFQENDPYGYIQKIMKGFANALFEIGEKELLEEERNKIFGILDKVVS
ncbi:MAG: hypothetical protein U0457_10140 [Candidatus Sericytochromatia bacterium]